jgi:hypothetical protein
MNGIDHHVMLTTGINQFVTRCVVVDQSNINNTYLTHMLRGTWSYSGLDQLRGLVTTELHQQISYEPRRVIAQIGFGKRSRP